MVDSTNEYQFLSEYIDERRRLEYSQYLKLYRIGYLISILGITRLVQRPVWNRFLLKKYQPLGYRKNAYEALHKEYRNIMTSCMMVKDQEVDKDIPIIILAAARMNDSWKEDQKKLINISKNCKLVSVEDSYHNIHFEQPEAVVNAIKEIICKQNR